MARLNVQIRVDSDLDRVNTMREVLRIINEAADALPADSPVKISQVRVQELEQRGAEAALAGDKA